MKKLLILNLFILSSIMLFAQNNPYKVFGYETDTTKFFRLQEQPQMELFYLQNTDSTAEVQMLAFDFANGKVRVYNAKDELLDILHFERGDVAFISTDPHWFNYPYQTPYSYVGNNPIMKIDPTGMDEWEIDRTGKIVNHIETDKHDAFFMVDKDRNRIDGMSISFKKGTISNTEQKGFGWLTTQTMFSVTGESEGAELFKFFADNTRIEYGLINTRDDGSFVMTNHKEDAVSASTTAQKISNSGKTVTSVVHNHPNNTQPSGFNRNDKSGDKFAAQQIETSHGYNVMNFVYQSASNNLVLYDTNSIISRHINWKNTFYPSASLITSPQKFYPGISKLPF